MSRRRLFQFMNEDPLVRPSAGKSQMLPVETHVPRSGRWSSNNNLGFSTPWDRAGDYRQTVIQLPEWGMPSPWILALGLSYTDVAAEAVKGFDLVADISFGAGGAEQRITCDWRQGTMLCLPMNALTVVGRYAGQIAAAEVPDDLILTATLARGARFGFHPILTQFVEGQPAGSGLTPMQRMPNFTARMSVCPTDSLTLWNDLFHVDNRLEFHSTPFLGGPVVRGYIQGAALVNYLDTGVTPTGSAHYWDFWNGSGNPISYQVVFHLDV